MRITVHGIPAPQGSKRHVGNGVMIESSAKVKPWRQDVKYAALAVFTETDVCATAGCDCDGATWAAEDPLAVEVTFYLPRPQGHYGTGRNAGTLKPSAPAVPRTKPDLDKLLRSTLDGLGNADIWVDDSRVATVTAAKRYADDRAPGADITITTITTEEKR